MVLVPSLSEDQASETDAHLANIQETPSENAGLDSH